MLWRGTGSAYCLGRKYQIEQHLFSILVRSCQLDVFYSYHWHSRQKEAFSRTSLGYTVFFSFLPLRESTLLLHTGCMFAFIILSVEEKEGNGEGFGEKTSIKLRQIPLKWDRRLTAGHCELYMRTYSRCWEMITQILTYPPPPPVIVPFPGITESWLRGQLTI